MGLTAVNGLLLYSAPDYGGFNNGISINAAGESHAVIGHLRLAGGATGKTFSAGGGAQIVWLTATTTWATAGSTVRVGLQDVDTTTGVEDTTFDVFFDYVQGTDALASSTYQLATMSSGTKTLSDGDLIAIVVEMTVRNGADSVQVSSTLVGGTQSNAALGFPYGSINNGIALAKSTTQLAYAVLKCDDGTVGWIMGTPVIRSLVGTVAVNSSSTPDEYAGVFTPTLTMQVCGIGVTLAAIGASDTFEVILYTDPFGSPSATVTVTADQDVVAGSASNGTHIYHIPPTTLTAGTTYAVAFRPTSVNNITYGFYDFVSTGVGTILRGALPLPALKLGTRSNQTGAFTDFGANAIPAIVLDVCGIDTGGSGYLPVA